MIKHFNLFWHNSLQNLLSESNRFMWVLTARNWWFLSTKFKKWQKTDIFRWQKFIFYPRKWLILDFFIHFWRLKCAYLKPLPLEILENHKWAFQCGRVPRIVKNGPKLGSDIFVRGFSEILPHLWQKCSQFINYCLRCLLNHFQD